jgi:hypothetical protein
LKLLILAILAIVFWYMLTGRWPWRSAAEASNAAAMARARNLLGVGKGASRSDIIEAHRKLVALVHPDRGGTSGQVHEANDARDLLLAGLASAEETP